MTEIRVLLADDHGLFRDGLRSLLRSQPDIEVVAESPGGADCVEACRRCAPDVVIVDLESPSETARVAREVCDECSGVRVLTLVGDADDRQLAEIIQAGVSGCLPVRWSGDDLLTAVRAVYRGAAYFDPTVLRSLLAHAEHSPSRNGQAVEAAAGNPGLVRRCAAAGRDTSASAPSLRGDERCRLNDREQATLALMGQGKSTEETARCLGVSTESVETFRTHAMDKLQMRNRVRLVRYAMRRGFRFE